MQPRALESNRQYSLYTTINYKADIIIKLLQRDSMGRLPSLSTVLVHEVDRYNILLKKIHISIENLQRAIKGFIVMSEELENVFVALVNNQVL